MTPRFSHQRSVKGVGEQLRGVARQRYAFAVLYGAIATWVSRVSCKLRRDQAQGVRCRSGQVAVPALALLVLAAGAIAIAPGAVSAEEPAGPAVGSQVTASAKGRNASLTITPTIFVPGQAVRFRGHVGEPGRRPVNLQSHLNRPGDTWRDVPNSRFRTDADGGFDFTFTAPSMFKIKYRVAGTGVATPSRLFNARPQEITLTLQGADADSQFSAVAPLLPFTVVADTTPAVRSALGTPPPFPGRTVLLQERVGNQWRTIQTGTTDDAGHAYFHVGATLLGQRVLRVRQERWTTGKNSIGWYASFPAYFSVLGVGDELPKWSAPTASRDWTITPLPRSAVRPTASEKYGWGASIFDFAWERGQDFDSPPSKGTHKKGTWLDTSDGSGRAAPFNGGLELQSKLKHDGPGDIGTTTATLQGNSRSTGRWEFRLQGFAYEGGSQPYSFRLDLVPEGTPVTACPPESVVVADAMMGSPGLTIGVRSQNEGSVWKRNLTGVRLGETPFNVAVEVGAQHTTWFVDGKPVGTVKDKGAHLGERLVPRFSLVGGGQEMNGAEVASDWQRGWSLAKGKQVTSGPALTRSGYAAC